MGATLGRMFTDYRTLVETCRARALELGLSCSEIERLGGLSEGFANKLLSIRPTKKPKRMWPTSLESMLGVLGLKILLIEDDATTAHTLARRTPVDHSQQRFGNVSRLTPKHPPALPPPALTVLHREQNQSIKYG
jgi:hypothetical protein